MVAVARALIILAIGLFPGTLAWGQGRTDVVRLANGDRVTGEIMHLERGRLELKTDDAGTIDFEWDNVASIESTRQFEIGTSDEHRMLGSLQPGVGRVITIISSDGDATLPMPEITTIYPIGASFWAKLDGSFNMGTATRARARLDNSASTRRQRFAGRHSLSSSQFLER